MSIAFFGQGMTNLGWTVISDIAPKQLIGLTSGIFNFSANLAGIITPLVIGITFQITGSFVGPLIYIGVVALIGAVSYSVILGDIHRLDVKRTSATDHTDNTDRINEIGSGCNLKNRGPKAFHRRGRRARRERPYGSAFSAHSAVRGFSAARTSSMARLCTGNTSTP